MTPVYIYKAKVLRVIDGDTFDAEVDVGFYMKGTFRFRLARVDCPELHSEIPEVRARAKEAQVFTAQRIVGKAVTLQTSKSDSFGRWMADAIYAIGDQEFNLSDELLAAGLAQLFQKGKDAV